MREHKSLRPQDVLILLRLLLSDRDELRQLDIGYELGISTTEVGTALKRLFKARLIDDKKCPIGQAATEFLIYGLKYIHSVEPGPISRGVPTAHSAPPLNETFQSKSLDASYVWPHGKGEVMGQAIVPLYKSAPTLKQKSPYVYKLLTLIDAIRVGGTRERNEAEKILSHEIKLATFGIESNLV